MQSEKLAKGIVLGILSLFCFVVEGLATAGLIVYVLPALNGEDSITRTAVTLLFAGYIIANGILAVAFGLSSYKALASRTAQA